MTASPNPIGCLLCNPSRVVPAPLPIPTQQPQQPFSFIALPNSLTCAPATFNWSYNGLPELFTLVISQAHPFQIHPVARMVKVRRDTTSFLVADDLEATDLTFTWPLVNVPSGWYVMQANGTGIFATSPEIFVGRGVNTSCLDTLPPPAPTFTSSTPTATIPTSELFVSTPIATSTLVGITPLPSVISLNSSPAATNTKQTAQIVGGLVGAAVLLAAVFAIYRLRQRRKLSLRLPMFLKRSHERFQQGLGSTFRSPAITSLSPVDDEKADHHGPQPEAMPFSSPSVPSISISEPDTGAPATAASTLDPKGEVQSQRSLTLAALNTNSTAPARSPSPSQSESASASSSWSDAGGSSLRTQRPRLVRTPAALNLNLNLSLSTPSSSARSQQTSFASGSATESPVPSSATSQMYRVRESGRSQWVSVGSGSPTVAEGVEADAEAQAGSRGTVIVQARRVLVTAGEMRAVRRDFPETPFPLSPDYR
ncbi:hypothetical protein GSI_10991 [Ganoderma sinense ZZ0214-1]|uniref:Uncharacterized protein n=1 Tax=Ganoderma sinense ZZ0214-1 TaxID=1077348 RepID=A0A2G8S275_9APHY|nr:hypothetical protein GSI_10991 [Ganoderma sinense ZZ0214-1]